MIKKCLICFLDGLYLMALCDSLNLVVLVPYRLEISNLERSLLKEHYLNVTYLQTYLESVCFKRIYLNQ